MKTRTLKNENKLQKNKAYCVLVIRVLSQSLPHHLTKICGLVIALGFIIIKHDYVINKA